MIVTFFVIVTLSIFCIVDYLIGENPGNKYNDTLLFISLFLVPAICVVIYQILEYKLNYKRIRSQLLFCGLWFLENMIFLITVVLLISKGIWILPRNQYNVADVMYIMPAAYTSAVVVTMMLLFDLLRFTWVLIVDLYKKAKNVS